MNIGLFTDTYYPQISGVATSVSTLKEQLGALGHKVYIFTTTDPKADPIEENICRIPSLPFVSERRLGVCYPYFKRIIRKLDLDIIHTHTEFFLGQLGRQMADELNIPHVHTMHTIYEEYTHYVVPSGMLDNIAKSAVNRLVVNFCNSADMVIVPTAKTRQLLTSYGVTRQIAVIPTGIDLERFSPGRYGREDISAARTELGISREDRVLLYIGRVSEEKNIGEILTHIKEYVKEKEGIKLLLVGDGPERKALEEKSKSLGIEQHVIFAGQRPWADIGKYYQLGDVFVTASRSETQGLTYIEALAAGLPVIAKADPCLDGVIENGVNGYTFEGKKDFLQILDELISNEPLCQRISVMAGQSAKEYSSKYFVDSVGKIYLSTIEAKLPKEYEVGTKMRVLT